MPVLLIVISKAGIRGESHDDVIVVGGVGMNVLIEREVDGLDVVPFGGGGWLDGLEWRYVR